MRQYKVTLIVETEEGDPAKWDWTDLIGDFAEVVSCEYVQDVEECIKDEPMFTGTGYDAKTPCESIEATVDIRLSELTDNELNYESFLNLLTSKIEEQRSAPLRFFQITDYQIVGYTAVSISMKVEGYEESNDCGTE